jgi:hypothetical protein
MDLLTAHAHFARRTDRSLCPVDLFVEINDRRVDVWPHGMAACASLSGWLDDCQDDDDLDEAVQHYGRCRGIGLFDGTDVDEEFERVVVHVITATLDRAEAALEVSMGVAEGGREPPLSPRFAPPAARRARPRPGAYFGGPLPPHQWN